MNLKMRSLLLFLFATFSVIDSHAENYDVVVSGGGPIGFAAALRFKKMGLKVLLIEQRQPATLVNDGRQPWGSRDRNVGLDKFAAKFLQDLTVSMDAFAPIIGMRFYQDGDSRNYYTPNSAPYYFAIRTAFGRTFGGTISISALEKRLFEASYRFGLQVEFGCKLTKIQNDRAEVICENEVKEIQAKYFVLAEGAESSNLKSLLALNQQKREVIAPPTYSVIAQFNDRIIPPGEYRIYFGRTGPFPFFGLALGGQNSTSFYATALEKVNEQNISDSKIILDMLARMGIQRKPHTISRFYNTADRSPSFVYNDRIFIIGDAAKRAHTAAGYNISSGIKDIQALTNYFNSTLRFQREPKVALKQFSQDMEREAQISSKQTSYSLYMLHSGGHFHQRSIRGALLPFAELVTRPFAFVEDHLFREKPLIDRNCSDQLLSDSDRLN